MAKPRKSLLEAAELAKVAQAASAGSAELPVDGTPTTVLSDRTTVLNDIATGRRRDVAFHSVEPERCRMWERHNRIYELLDSNNCSDLIERIALEGQKFPAIVRRLQNDPDGYEYEVIAGARRHFSVNYLRQTRGRTDILYLIEVRKMSDEEAFQLSDLENRDRADISDYERGLDYRQALADYYGGKVKLMAERISMTRQTLSLYVNLANLPEIIIKAYGDPTAISVRHASTLAPMLNNPRRNEHVLAKAKEIAAEQENALKVGPALAYDGVQVFKALSAAGSRDDTARKPAPKKLSITGEGGDELCSIEKGPRYVTVKIPVSKLDQKDAVLKGLNDVL